MHVKILQKNEFDLRYDFISKCMKNRWVYGNKLWTWTA